MQYCSQADALSSSGFRVIVPDVKGFGASSMPEAVGAYNLKVVAEDVFSFLDYLKVEK